MANRNRRAGKSTRQMAASRRKSALMIGLLGLGAITLVGLFLQNSQALGLGGAGIFLLLLLLIYLDKMIDTQVDKKIKTEKRAVRGARAEEAIEDLLDLLDENYYVLHDIDTPYGNVDHIVISRYGYVFLLETKAHGGKVEVVDNKILVNGRFPEKNFVSQTLRNTYWLRDEIYEAIQLKIWITPIVVFTNAFVVPSKPIKGVRVVNKKYVLQMLRNTRNKSSAISVQLWEQRESLERLLQQF